jgi:putative ABC transport system substrate-binding protein
MRRREFIALLGGAAAAWPLAARAQQRERMRRIGLLAGSEESDLRARSHIAGFQQALQALGWTPDHNIRIEHRWTSDPNIMPAHAADLVGRKPDVILTTTNSGLAAVQQESGIIPIVFVMASDPVGSGFAASYARPGGNVTGFTNFESSIAGKWLELVKEIAPYVKRVAIIVHPETPASVMFLPAAKGAARLFGAELTVAGVHDAAEIERAITAFAAEPNGALICTPHAVTSNHRKVIIGLAERHRLPAIYPWRDYVAADGGLMSYGINALDRYRQAASYVDRILRGAHPGELPIQAPTKFELIINLKTAKALGLTVPETLLARADEVIE